MPVEAVVGLLELFDAHGIEVWVDGGWGVDALLGEQTRPHQDLDIALRHRDVLALRRLLEARGYRDVPRDDTRDCNFVLGDAAGHLIDIHSFTLDEAGKNIFGVAYEPGHLTGTGAIGGRPVQCIPPRVMVDFHAGYEVDETDYQDVKALCDRFAIVLPDAFRRFEVRGG